MRRHSAMKDAGFFFFFLHYGNVSRVTLSFFFSRGVMKSAALKEATMSFIKSNSRRPFNVILKFILSF